MLYYKQEHLVIPGIEDTKGSCYPTVLACLLDKELHRVPYFHLMYWDERERNNLLSYAKQHFLDGKVLEECETYQQDNYHQFMSQQINLWNTVLTTWLIAQGLKEAYIVKIDEYIKDNPDTPYLAGGMSSRGVSHVVVYMNGKLLHDPHPSNEGLVKIDNYRYLMPCNDAEGKYWGELEE